MRIASLQMNMKFACPDENFGKAERLIRDAAKSGADTVLLPETWNVGFFPRENLKELADVDGKRTKMFFSSLAKELNINIVAGSVANLKNDKVYNTCFVFDRKGNLVAEYDKTHLFTPMGEDNYFEKGDRFVTFELDGKKCSVIICYDIRFPELTRSITTKGLDYLFVVSQWPKVRTLHLKTLAQARAIENQMFLAYCNSCGVAGETVYGGNSMIFGPWGDVLAEAGDSEQIIFADCDESILKDIRETINVFRDRRPEIYSI